MRRLYSLAILAVASLGLAGCVAYPAGPSYGGYYAPAPAYYAAPAVSLNYSSGWGGGWHRYRHW